ncbi:MAG: hypothetical protein EP300_02880 [Gammaproteobacteria bacterium]|nr:MAG: hypothetical protein EP300_02880 [Gammaproteobacteria bacterium]
MIKSFRHILAAFACLASTALFAQSTPAPARHDIDVMLKPATGAITINDRIELEGRPHYRFRLAPWLEIDSLEVDGETVKVQRQGHEQVVDLPDDRRHVVEFSLRGLLPRRGQGGQANMQGSSA